MCFYSENTAGCRFSVDFFLFGPPGVKTCVLKQGRVGSGRVLSTGILLVRRLQLQKRRRALVTRQHCSPASSAYPCAHARSLLRKSHIEPHLHAGSVLKQPGASSKSLPCFQSLMVGFQLRLVRGSWQPLLVLGLAQERVDLGAREASLLLQT